jgi:predicted anti-sigma-YlaC factor YlaD
MRCPDFRDLISADLDGEATDAERQMLAGHLRSCPDCAAAAEQAQALHRALRLHDPGPVPDLSAAIVAAHLDGPATERPRHRPVHEPPGTRTGDATDARRRERRLGWARYGLVVVALTQLVLIVPFMLVEHGEAGSHVAHDLDTWAAAFAVGLLVVAWQPDRARGLFPMAATFAAITFAMVGTDLAAGRVASATEAPHLLELVGVALVAVTARLDGGRSRRLDRPAPAGGPRSGPQLVLR